jgi:putative DNA primase/helicase
VIVANEGKQGVKMNTAMIKNHTGGDIIQARHLRKGVFQMDPKFTLVMITNHLPKFPANDWALWSRVKAVRFPVSFAGREDRTLKDTFRDKEAEGIAAWVVRGAVRYYSEGLRDAESVSKATEKYREGSDELLDSGMVGELFEYDENSRASRPEFNRLLRAWREANQCGPTEWTPKRVKELLLASGHDVQEENQGRIFKGIRLLNYGPTQGKSGSGAKGVHAEPGGSAVQTGQETLDLEPEEDDLADVEPEELDI